VTSIAIAPRIWKIREPTSVWWSTAGSQTERRTPVEDREKLSPAEPESDVEGHKVSPAASEEPRTEGESDDDVEAHKVSPA
jgi:hypothetical protein